MEISGFRAAAGKRLGVEFTVSLFHIVKLNFELLRLGVLSSWITFPSGDDVKARCEGQTAAHFIKINKVRFSVLRYVGSLASGGHHCFPQVRRWTRGEHCKKNVIYQVIWSCEGRISC